MKVPNGRVAAKPAPGGRSAAAGPDLGLGFRKTAPPGHYIGAGPDRKIFDHIPPGYRAEGQQLVATYDRPKAPASPRGEVRYAAPSMPPGKDALDDEIQW
jgi:hypothetical protein